MDDRINKQRFTCSVAAAGSTGTVSDPCNPINGTLKNVRIKCANDANVSGLKVELVRTDSAGGHAYITVYTGSDNAIPDNGEWHEADAVTNVDVPLNFAQDGNYTWRITPDAVPAAAMSVSIERTFLS